MLDILHPTGTGPIQLESHKIKSWSRNDSVINTTDTQPLNLTHKTDSRAFTASTLQTRAETQQPHGFCLGALARVLARFTYIAGICRRVYPGCEITLLFCYRHDWLFLFCFRNIHAPDCRFQKRHLQYL